MNILKLTQLCIVIFVFTNPIFSFSETIKANITECEKATGISKGISVSIAESLKVPMASVSFISTYLDKKYNMCYLKVDTSIGPKSCLVSAIYTDGKDFWVGGGCN